MIGSTHFSWLIALALAAVPRGAAATDTESYRVTIAQALERYRATDWDGARAAFEQAYAIQPGARPLRGIALSAYYARDYLQAATAFERALADNRQPLSPEQRAQARDFLGRAYLYVGQIQITTRPADASVRVDGDPLPAPGRILLAPGHYRIDVISPGCEPNSRDIEVGAGQQLNLHIELALTTAPPAEGSTTKAADQAHPAARADAAAADTASPHTAVWIAAGATVVFAAAAGGFALLTRDELGDLRAACAQRSCDNDTRTELWRDSPIETYETLTNLALVASALGAGASATLLVLSLNQSEEEQALSLDVSGSSLRLRGQF